ncbi:acid phosphatase pho5 [Ascosphaera acerosa]|nr:acid phosphatase pho5 [Ascosphaera acerosa]
MKLTTLVSATAAAAGLSLAYTPRPGLHFQEPPSGNKLSQQFGDDFNVLKYSGGRGPYIDRRSAGVSREPPEQCAVDQIVYLSRHGERYPTGDDGKHIHAALGKLQRVDRAHLRDQFEFLRSWTSYIPDDCALEAETTSGPYSGLEDAYHRGTAYAARYGHLLDVGRVTPIFTAGFSRVINTARKFGEGFFGYNYSTSAALNVVSEFEYMGANSLTPSCWRGQPKSCDKLKEDMPQLKALAARLNEGLPGANLTVTDAYYLMALGALELNARPWSPWITLFTMDEWVAFNYVNGLEFHNCFGPGDPAQVVIGSVFLNATITALNEGPEHHPILLNFAHDSQLTPLMAALHLSDSGDLPSDRVAFGAKWQITDIVPMGAHVVFERLSCSAGAGGGAAGTKAGTYVRIVWNEGVIPIPECQDGPGYSCSLHDFTEHFAKLDPDYTAYCKVPKEYPQHFEMWWNYNTTTKLNYQKGPIGCGVMFSME